MPEKMTYPKSGVFPKYLAGLITDIASCEKKKNLTLSFSDFVQPE